MKVLRNIFIVSLLFSVVAVFLLPSDILAEVEEEWAGETIIDVSIVGESVINLDSSNTLVRAYVDITNYDPSDGYYFLRITQPSTNTIISEENIIIREKSNGKAGADVAHMVSEDEISHTGILQGYYDILVYTEYGNAIGNATFSVIKPSEPLPQTSSELLESNEEDIESDASDESELIESESELINAKKIPDWIKNIFVLYSYDEISEDELLHALKYLIEQGIIEISL